MECQWHKDELALLKSTFLFRGMSADDLQPLLARSGACRRNVRRGDVIYSPTHYERSIGILLSGSIQVTKSSGDGPPMVISVLRKGDLFGAAALFNDEEEYATTLTARSDCALVMLTQGQVSALLAADPFLSANYIRYLSGRIRFLGDKIDSLIAGSGERKLAHYLLAHAEETGVVRLSCSLTELAERLHMGRASLYRAFDKLEADGTLTRQGKQIVLLCPERLSIPSIAAQ